MTLLAEIIFIFLFFGEHHSINNLYFRMWLQLQDGVLIVCADVIMPSEWTNIVGNYLGLDEGIMVYYNGTQLDGDIAKSTYAFNPLYAGDGRIVVGQHYTDFNNAYTTVQVDELLFFNSSLTTYQIMSLYNGV